MNIRIKRVHPNAVIPKYATNGASGFDLVAVEDVIIAPGETKLVRTGLAFEIPPGYEMQIRPRSGVTLKTKLRVGNAPGTIDSDFRGEVAVIVDNAAPLRYNPLCDLERTSKYRTIDGAEVETECVEVCVSSYGNRDYYEKRPRTVLEGTYIIRAGDRIAQGVIAPIVRAEFTEADELSDTQRGAGGFGHTGTKSKEGGSE